MRPLKKSDLSRVARIHRGAFPESALTKIGDEAVRRYYLWQLEGPHEVVALGAWRGEKLVGFCFGGTFRGALTGFLQRNRAFLLRRVLMRPWLICNPLFRDRFALAVRVLARRFRDKSSGKSIGDSAAKTSGMGATNAPATAPRFGVLAVGVDSQTQGEGVGQKLMQACEEQAWQRGFSKMNLSVHPANARAVRFYEKQDWQRINEASGAWKGAMEKRNPQRSENL